MKAITSFLTAILMVCIIAFFAPQKVLAQTVIDSVAKTEKVEKKVVVIPASQPESATFFQTLLRTPFAILTTFITFFSCAFVGFLEFWGYLFSGFSYKFPIVHEIWQIGWQSIVKNWWWKPGVTWHLIVSIILCTGVLGGRR